MQQHGRIDMLVNNAGGQFISPAENITLGGMKAVMELNVLGTWLVTLAVFKCWMKSNGGRIVNITADFRNGFPLMMHTGAARAAVDNCTTYSSFRILSHAHPH
jgi:NAD(P)-dependent dehydrogenase (short-subunit alcohol dehydrogenase family)